MIRLSHSESRVLSLVAEGYTNRAIARRLHYKEGSVATTIRVMLSKLGIEGVRGASEFNPRVLLAKVAGSLPTRAYSKDEPPRAGTIQPSPPVQLVLPYFPSL